MSEFAWALLLKPFAAFTVLLVAALTARGILKAVPDGRFKRLLTRRLGP